LRNAVQRTTVGDFHEHRNRKRCAGQQHVRELRRAGHVSGPQQKVETVEPTEHQYHHDALRRNGPMQLHDPPPGNPLNRYSQVFGRCALRSKQRDYSHF